MKQFIGTKIIKAIQMDRAAAEAHLQRNVGGDKHGDGYLVEYDGGYQSWSPKDVFEDAYRPTSGMPFGLAIEAMKKGAKVARAGWNGKGMWLIMVPGTKAVNFTEGSPYMKAGLTHGEILPHIDMYTVNSEGRRAMLPGWLASQTDMLSDDWAIIQ
jgi:hypothetical protein